MAMKTATTSHEYLAVPQRIVHADASNFAAGISKRDAYAQVLDQAAALFHEQRNWVCNLSNTASLLYHLHHSLPSPSSSVNWAGFYVLDPSSSRKPSLILGPFMGKVACQTIAFGRGVCGTAAQEARTVLVPDVEEFPGHIACDGDSRSEIVVPIVQGGVVKAIIDIDCAEKNCFDEEDRVALEKLAALLAESCDF
ncbi:GAF domain-like protein [Myriangium duriaei CBS 260.36]|uniref:GAF domain-like protein n=1 Tax=Myriangium duriaei CBS 260.36 TaxID=1168546 RepID=A0A9P4J5L2_9PEZI|nr:GAF domain-like protein [Myriangium duriaei CBS 260.36]